MAGNYDALSVSERSAAVENVIQELQLCQRANAAIQKHYSRVMTNQNVVDWVNMWLSLEAMVASAKTHAVNANSQLDTLLHTDGGPFKLQYEWVVGRGGISHVIFEDGGNTLTFYDVIGEKVVMPTSGLLTANSILLVEGTEDNDGDYTVSSVGTWSLDITGTFATPAETSYSARVRVIRTNVV